MRSKSNRGRSTAVVANSSSTLQIDGASLLRVRLRLGSADQDWHVFEANIARNGLGLI